MTFMTIDGSFHKIVHTLYAIIFFVPLLFVSIKYQMSQQEFDFPLSKKLSYSTTPYVDM